MFPVMGGVEASPCFPKTKEGTKGIKEEQSSSDGAGDNGDNVLWVFSFIWLYGIAKVVEKLPKNQDTSQDAHSDHFSSDEKSAHGDDKSHDDDDKSHDGDE